MARKYKLKFAEGTPIDDGFLDHIDNLFSQLGIAPDVAQHLADGWQSFVGQRMAAEAAQAQRAADAVRAEHGSGFNEAVAKGQKAINSLGLNANDLQALEKAAGTGPAARLLIKLGQRFDASAAPAASPSAGGTGATGGSDPFASPEQARAEIDRLGRSPAWIEKLFNPKAEGHVEAKDRWTMLHAAAFPAPAEAGIETGAADRDGFIGTLKSACDAKAPRDKINELIGDANFMASLQDKSHSQHAANRQIFDDLHAEAGLTR